MRREFPGARAYLSVQPEGQRRFRATLELTSDGRMLLTGLSPLGTTLFRLYSEGGRVLFLNDARETWWEGTLEEFSGATGLFQGIAVTRLSDLAFLLFGLPADAGAVAGEERGGVIHRAGRTGLESAAVAGGGGEVRYEPAVYPPVRVVVAGGGGKLTVEHLDRVDEPVELQPPAPPSSWTCCVLPRVLPGAAD